MQKQFDLNVTCGIYVLSYALIVVCEKVLIVRRWHCVQVSSVLLFARYYDFYIMKQDVFKLGNPMIEIQYGYLIAFGYLF